MTDPTPDPDQNLRIADKLLNDDEFMAELAKELAPQILGEQAG